MAASAPMPPITSPRVERLHCDAIGLGDAPRDFLGDDRLADAARAGDRHESDIVATQEIDERADVGFSAHQ